MSYLSLKWTYCLNFSSVGEKCGFIAFVDVFYPYVIITTAICIWNYKDDSDKLWWNLPHGYRGENFLKLFTPDRW